MLAGITSLDLLAGPVPLVVGALACLAGIYLLARNRRRWLLWVAGAVLASAIAAVGINWWAVHAAQLSAYDLPLAVQGWCAVAVLGLVLAVLNLVGATWRRRLLAPVAMLVVILCAALQINAYFGQYRTIDDITGAAASGIAPLPTSAKPASPDVGTSAGGGAASGWEPPAQMPGRGSVYSVDIPGTVSGFSPRTGYVYLPPAYNAANGPRLPVLVLIAGQPGSPQDWLGGGQLSTLMDSYAGAHRGLAPVVVVVDANGSTDGNTMCMDSNLAKADTYLTQDVPAWIKASLMVDANPQRWAMGGFSFGGTCSIQMAALHPDIYPNALDFSGEKEPALSADRATTVKTAFGGDTAAFDALTPLNVLAKGQYSDSWAYFAAGAQDSEFGANMAIVSAAASTAGMKVRTQLVAGAGHAWAVPIAAMGPALDWLAPRMGLAS
ncbi:alpha/beta hydrolase [Arthrobacter sp. 35W]|uniref:alpha/beta hydrolase n=1 Tax=Arthrobacter sp. 35W TaxID=1132441 RepID=UPI00040B828D|nr:alpha/beta hydrolase-fold protein [Arthrobacter sp. 35W]